MVEAIAKLVEAIRDPRPRARGKTVWPGRAERAADDAGEKMARGAPSTNFAIASTSQIEGNRGALIILIVMAALQA